MISIYYMENASICIQSFGTITTGMFKTHLKKYMYYLNKFCKYLKKKKKKEREREKCDVYLQRANLKLLLKHALHFCYIRALHIPSRED